MSSAIYAIPGHQTNPFNNDIIRRGVAMVVAWIIIVNLFGLIAFNRLTLLPDTAFKWMAGGVISQPKQSWNIIEIHNRWDSYWYLDIARNGYYLRGNDDTANVVFFPLYPLLIRAAAPLAGGNLVLSGWMISCIFLIMAAIMLIRLTQAFHPGIHPLFPLIFLLTYPTSFLLNAVYSESLFLFLSLSMIYFARKQNFLAASLFAGLASATRIAGIFLCALLLAEFIQSRGWRSLLRTQVLPLVLAPSGAVAFFCYHWIKFGNFFLYLKIQDNWGRDFEFTASDYVARNSAYLVNMVYDLFFMTLVAVLGILTIKRLRVSYGVYMLVSIGAALSSGTALGVVRYSMILFPIHLLAATISSPVGRGAWLLTSTLFMALTIICYVNHYWIG